MGELGIARAETVGSLLRPPGLLEARAKVTEGALSPGELRQLEDAAILEAIEMQERCGLDVITDGELRRSSFALLTDVLDCFETRPGGPGLTWHEPDGQIRAGSATLPFPAVVRPIGPVRRRRLEEEYAFLAANARVRTKFTLPTPSYHRRYWNEEHSRGAYPSCERFLEDVLGVLREVVEGLVAQGCDYIQLDGPNYGSMCDPGHRARLAAAGRDLDADLAFDAELDSSLFSGLTGVTSALHICRGNGPGGIWHSSGGYAVISQQLFPKLAFDTLLLEYDTDRAGDFGPLADPPGGTVVVLGLLTTKSGQLETREEILARVHEAASVKPLEELALSTQCGFASVAPGNPLSPADEEAKLALVGDIARELWGPALGGQP